MNLTDLIKNYSCEEFHPRRPYIIAEAGVNHEGRLDLARRLIDEAAAGGAHAIKFQTYRAEMIASKDSPSYWDLTKEPTDSQYLLFKKYDKFWKAEFEALKCHCDRAGIDFLSTPFDVESAHFLDDLMDVFKISSSDLNNKPFIDILCGFGKPIVLSTGASYMWEVQQAVETIQAHGNSLALLHCVLNYPTDDANANLAMILGLRRAYPRLAVGYSDHTLPRDMQVLETATLLGACILEKHFTHDKTLLGNDHYHAMDQSDLQRLHERLDRVFGLLGDIHKQPLASEASARANARRSLVAACAIPAGKTVEAADLTWKRPGRGIDPRDYDHLLGRSARHDIIEDTILEWSMFDA